MILLDAKEVIFAEQVPLLGECLILILVHIATSLNDANCFVKRAWNQE